MELANLIPDLLYKHNCVILPGFGGFIANFKACEIQEERFLISPSRKIIAFNQSLVENDGLLISALSKSQNIAYSEAEREVAAYISHIESRLEKYKNFEFKNIGTFYLNSEKNLLFVPYQGLNFLQKSFGLPDVKVKPLFDKIPLETQKSNTPKVVRLEPKHKRTAPSLYKVAAAAIIILMIGGFGVMQLSENRSLDRMADYQRPSDHLADSHNAATASVFPVDILDNSDNDLHPEEEIEEIEQSQTYSDSTIEISEELPEDLMEIVEEETPAIPEIEVKEEKAPVVALPQNNLNDLLSSYKSIMNGRNYFHVIIGEYDELEEANKKRESYEQKAYSAKLFDTYKQGKYLLSLEHFTKEEHAIAFQREVRKSERRRTWIIELKNK
jgi:hypothetical protein